MNRSQSIQRLKKESFDILIIGGGATGSGAALEAVCRGLKTALVEREDFASETSSRSTKLLHGGVRYLEQAVTRLDYGQYHLVKEALSERQTLTHIAPHLSWVLPLMTPLYRVWDIPYYTAGLMLYDKISGSHSLGPSRFVTRAKLLELFPMLDRTDVKGGVLYYDGQFDDARMAVSLAMTASGRGAVVGNHLEVIRLIKRNDRIHSVRVRDRLSSEEFEIHAKTFINATGPFGDRIREMDNPRCRRILATSSGAHIVVDRKYCSRDAGILIPKTVDGRVLFVLPWLGSTVIGTTDEAAPLEENPRPTSEQIRYILGEVKRNLGIAIPPAEIRSAWSGLRPLVGGGGGTTARMSRDHYIETSRSGLTSIMGGKWTTYRLMAEDVVDAATENQDFVEKSADTSRVKLVGAENYRKEAIPELARAFDIAENVARHLAHNYGDRAEKILQEGGSRNRPLIEGHPYLESEIAYAVEHEMAATPADFLCRRTRLFFLDQKAALSAIDRTTELFAEVSGWDAPTRETRAREARDYLSLPRFNGVRS